MHAALETIQAKLSRPPATARHVGRRIDRPAPVTDGGPAPRGRSPAPLPDPGAGPRLANRQCHPPDTDPPALDREDKAR